MVLLDVYKTVHPRWTNEDGRKYRIQKTVWTEYWVNIDGLHKSQIFAGSTEQLFIFLSEPFEVFIGIYQIMISLAWK